MIARLRNRLLLRWLANRIPGKRRHQLDVQSIFILPTFFGSCFFILCLCLFILGTNYQNNMLLLLTYFFIALGLINLFASYHNFARIQLQAKGVSPVYAGDNATFQFQLTAPHHQQPSGELHVQWWGHDSGITVDLDESAGTISLPRFTYRRGIFSLPRVTFASEYPLGLFRCWTHLDFTQPLTVYPKLSSVGAALRPLQGEDDTTTLHAPGHDDFQLLKSYHPGDPVQRIAWKSVAKGGPPVVKVFSEQAGSAGYLMLDPNSDTLEEDISSVAYQIVSLSQQNLSFGLKAGQQIIPASTGDAHRHQCLALLAALPETPSQRNEHE